MEGQEDYILGAAFKPAAKYHTLRELRVVRGLPDFHLVAALPRWALRGEIVFRSDCATIAWTSALLQRRRFHDCGRVDARDRRSSGRRQPGFSPETNRDSARLGDS